MKQLIVVGLMSILCVGCAKQTVTTQPEATPIPDESLIKTALYQKNNWKDNEEITVTVKTNDGKYASGLVNSSGGGGYFYAIKENNAWKIVADGNGILSCGLLKDYPDYPNTLITTCIDETTQELVKR